MTAEETEFVGKLRTATEDKLGTFAETVWENIFKASGVRFIPLAKLNVGGAPKVMASGGGPVLPDFDCAGEEWAAYIDSKCKSGPIMFRKKKQWRHGIDRKNWLAYKQTAAIFNKSAGLGIIELFTDAETKSDWSGQLLVQRLTELGTPIEGESNQRHMVYWPTKFFCTLDSLTPLELRAAYRGQPSTGYSASLTRVFAPMKQGEFF